MPIVKTAALSAHTTADFIGSSITDTILKGSIETDFVEIGIKEFCEQETYVTDTLSTKNG